MKLFHVSVDGSRAALNGRQVAATGHQDARMVRQCYKARVGMIWDATMTHPAVLDIDRGPALIAAEALL